MSEMDEIIKDFLIESLENLDRLDREFVELERAPGRQDLLASIFRAIHTVKGTCGFFGFSKLERLTHAGESLLSRLRDGQRTMTPACAEALLAMVDGVRAMLASVESRGDDGDQEYPALIEVLGRLTSGEEVSLRGTTPAAPLALVSPPSVAAPPDAPAPTTPSAPAPAPELVLAQTARAEEAPAAGAEARTQADATVRVDVSVLDHLMVLVGELVLARNQALQATKGGADGLENAYQRIDHVTASLQEAVMRTRMLPLGNLFNRYPRVVRDLAAQCAKQVRLEIAGADTGLDRTLLEAIKDPLTHIVRNAIDHGFETPAARVAAGKPAEGRLLLRAFHEGGRVTIEIADDGGGIDVVKVRRRAVERGLLTEAAAARLSDREALDIIFMPGFSTADNVTNLSGRGVGMDVVRTNIAALGGTVDLESTRGRGTRLQLRVPLTLAIVPALIVRSAGERFAIPQVSVQEIIRLTDAGPALEMVQGVPVYRLREHLLPILRLDAEFGLSNTSDADKCIVVLLVGRQPFGLLLDGVADHMDIVVKPIGKRLPLQGFFSGATVLGDGSVSLILDVAGLAQRAQMRARGQDESVVQGGVVRAAATERIILLRGGDDSRLMVPLAEVTRIEEIARDRVERESDGQVVQYRGRIMPLVTLDARAFDSSELDADASPLSVLVHSGPRGDVGVVVAQVLDVVDAELTERRPANRPGVRFSAIVRDRVTQMLDLREVVRDRIPNFYDAPAEQEVAA